MSRCFPYPPPGYSLASRGDGKGPLIESIKLQKDKEKAKEERRKDRKREEKKDKKRKRKLQSNQTVDGFGQGELKKEKSRKLEKQTSNLKGKYTQSHGDDESSDVTEEHKQPVCVVIPSYSSENSQNSNKRRHESTTNTIKADTANTIKVDGSVLKIRISSFKKKGLNVVNRDDVGPSTSGRMDPFGQKDSGFGPRLVKMQSFSTSNSTGICAPGLILNEKQPSLRFVDARTSSQDVAVSKPSTSKASKAELLYKSLLESWAPPAQGTEWYDDEEQDWLFKTKSQNTKRSETNSNAPCSLNSNLWPRAQFLPSVDTYALPYTVPF